MKRRMVGVNFSPEVIVWKKRMYVWNSMTRWHKGVCINCTIIKCRTKACGIQRPLSTTLTEATRAYKICRDEFDRLKPGAGVYRENFLARRVKEELARGNIKREE